MHGKLMALLVVAMGPLNTHLLADDIVLQGPDTRGTLVELYSSEGCSSCPPAEAWISRLKNDSQLWKQIVPVVFHVDYWDGLGWPDRFARKAYTQRQSDYQARWNSTTVYTPEFIVDAREWRRSMFGSELPLAKAETVGPIRVVVNRNDWSAKIEYAPASPATAQNLTVNVAWLGMNIDTDVRGGENDGRKLEHDFVALDFQSKSATSSADNKITAEFPAPSIRSSADHPAAIAVWISRDDGSIVQVTGDLLK